MSNECHASQQSYQYAPNPNSVAAFRNGFDFIHRDWLRFHMDFMGVTHLMEMLKDPMCFRFPVLLGMILDAIVPVNDRNPQGHRQGARCSLHENPGHQVSDFIIRFCFGHFMIF